MKQFSTFLNGVLASTLVFILFFSIMPNARAGATKTPQPTAEPQPVCNLSRTVQVSGTAVVNVTPDRALIQLGVQSNDVTPQKVQTDNTIAIQRVIKALQSLGIESKDIATDLYIIEPVYDDYSSLYIKGYRINNIVAVTMRDVSKTSAVIAAALEAGANQVVNVDLYTSELRKFRDQARGLAMKAATEKAQALAQAAGAAADCVLTISENSWSYYNGWWASSNRSQWTQNVVQNSTPSGNSAGTTETGPVSLGQISIQAQVSVSFSLK